MENIVILSGAGISAESGLKTFRDSNGLWEGHDVMEVASPDGWHKNRALVLDFYNQRRRQLKTVKPNAAHQALVDLEKQFDVHIITQNVDDLHERAGSSKVLHLHGELLKARSTTDENLVIDWHEDICEGDLCAKGSQLRPHIVWFGELVPLLEPAIELTAKADYIIIVGTSMQVYPAASLINYAKPEALIYFIDPKPNIASQKNLKVIAEKASAGVPIVVEELLSK
ncbi:SIR2 family NAD-dependent protein deacylase [Leeuwenhoekiella nanhaiensis]|uniref:NAD-dependent protein deacylase n=1 Tax=Leeuwenhoekiella nanhaiensis TaxID=1655491 RepID=A0A2G1VQ40_9FLAO|nr:NAD-dependent deacylase [Leeuwenhoekiella nanhaiensis]PHQ28887.1 NAD-dependent protein deacylase [Leeuwenhoekiella nanhaiensis]